MMPSNGIILLKLFAAAVLFATWGWFVYMGKTDISTFIGFIQSALIGLATHSIFNSNKPKVENETKT